MRPLIVRIVGCDLIHDPFHHLLKTVESLRQWRFGLLPRLMSWLFVKLLAAAGRLALLAADAYCVLRGIKLALDFAFSAWNQLAISQASCMRAKPRFLQFLVQIRRLRGRQEWTLYASKG